MKMLASQYLGFAILKLQPSLFISNFQLISPSHHCHIHSSQIPKSHLLQMRLFCVDDSGSWEFMALVLVWSRDLWHLTRPRAPRADLVPSLVISLSGTETHTNVHFIYTRRIKTWNLYRFKILSKVFLIVRFSKCGDVFILNLIIFSYFRKHCSTCTCLYNTLYYCFKKKSPKKLYLFIQP